MWNPEVVQINYFYAELDFEQDLVARLIYFIFLQ